MKLEANPEVIAILAEQREGENMRFRTFLKGLDIEVEQQIIDGVSLNIYSPEKTIADCFKYRNQLGTDLTQQSRNQTFSKL